MSLRLLPFEIIEQISKHLHTDDRAAYHAFRFTCKKTFRLPEIQTQQEFDEILRKRYRKVALRLYLKFEWIVPTQSFAEKAAEYGHLDALMKMSESCSIDFQSLFRHSVRMNLAKAVSHLVQLQQVDALENGQAAMIVAAMQGHQEVLEELLKLDDADPNKCIEYAGTDEIEKILRRDRRCQKRLRPCKTKSSKRKKIKQ